MDARSTQANKQLPLPIVQRPVGELVCEKWRAIFGTKPPPQKVIPLRK